jgi:hypothetical protein
MHYSRSHHVVIRVYDEAGDVIETHEYKGDFIGRSATDRRFEFQKRSHLFIGTQNLTLAGIAAIVVRIVRSEGGYKPPFPIPKTQSAFRRHGQ